jgi:hypothetical protein
MNNSQLNPRVDFEAKEEFSQFKREHKGLSKSELISMLFYFKNELEKIKRALRMYDNAHTLAPRSVSRSRVRKSGRLKRMRTRRGFLENPGEASAGGHSFK